MGISTNKSSYHQRNDPIKHLTRPFGKTRESCRTHWQDQMYSLIRYTKILIGTPESNITARDQAPTGTAHSADPYASTAAYRLCFAVKNEQKSLKHNTPLQRQALLAKQASPVLARCPL